MHFGEAAIIVPCASLSLRYQSRLHQSNRLVDQDLVK